MWCYFLFSASDIHLHNACRNPINILKTTLYLNPLCSQRSHEDFGARSIYLGYGYVFVYHRIRWDLITCPCLGYPLLAPESSYISWHNDTQCPSLVDETGQVACDFSQGDDCGYFDVTMTYDSWTLARSMHTSGLAKKFLNIFHETHSYKIQCACVHVCIVLGCDTERAAPLVLACRSIVCEMTWRAIIQFITI